MGDPVEKVIVTEKKHKKSKLIAPATNKWKRLSEKIDRRKTVSIHPISESDLKKEPSVNCLPPLDTPPPPDRDKKQEETNHNIIIAPPVDAPPPPVIMMAPPADKPLPPQFREIRAQSLPIKLSARGEKSSSDNKAEEQLQGMVVSTAREEASEVESDSENEGEVIEDKVGLHVEDVSQKNLSSTSLGIIQEKVEESVENGKNDNNSDNNQEIGTAMLVPSIQVEPTPLPTQDSVHTTKADVDAVPHNEPTPVKVGVPYLSPEQFEIMLNEQRELIQKRFSQEEILITNTCQIFMDQIKQMKESLLAELSQQRDISVKLINDLNSHYENSKPMWILTHQQVPQGHQRKQRKVTTSLSSKNSVPQFHHAKSQTIPSIHVHESSPLTTTNTTTKTNALTTTKYPPPPSYDPPQRSPPTIFSPRGVDSNEFVKDPYCPPLYVPTPFLGKLGEPEKEIDKEI